MSIINPGTDSAHIIAKAMKAKTLTTLSKEQDALKAGGKVGVRNSAEENPFQKFIYTADTIKEIKNYCKDKTPDEILKAMGIEVHYDAKGTKSISHYGWPRDTFSFAEAGIDEKELLKDVKYISGHCDLTGSRLKNLGSVEAISGVLYIPFFTKLEDLSSVKYVGAVECNGENAEDISKLFKKLNFNPKTIRKNSGWVPHVGMLSDTTSEAVKRLEAKIRYENKQQ